MPDITKAIDILNWKPKIELKEGVEKSIKYYIDKQNSEDR